MPKVLSLDDVSSFRERICDVAETVFAEQGIDGVSMRTIADAAGVSRMTPYRYFAAKSDIVAAVRARGFARMADRMEATAAAIADPTQRLRGLGEAYLAFAEESPDAYRLMHEISQDDESRYPDLVEQIRRSQQPLLDACREAHAAGTISGDPVEVMHVLWAGIHGLNALHLADKLHLGRSISDLAPTMLDALARGVAPSPHRRTT